jgi:glycerophosphoryl diester phosphodiesterase
MSAADRPYFSLEHPIRLAHRGSRTLWPENTAYAFQQAIDLGYRYIETDVRMTRDGVIVVFHDPSLERTTGGAGDIAKLDWSHLEPMDAAHHYQPEAGYPLRRSGIGIPRLGDILATFPDTHFNIDLKAPGMEWAVADVVKRAGAEDRMLVGSFFDGRLRKFRRITRGTIATSAGPAAAAALWAASRLGRQGPAVPDAYQIPPEAGPMRVDERMVQAAHSRGAHVHIWTINEAEEMRRLLALGVDGIITDRPDVLNEVLED